MHSRATLVLSELSSLVFEAGDIRKGKLALLTRVFIDDSADGPRKKFILAAGVMGTCGEWSRFGKKWKAALRAEPRIDYWHSREHMPALEGRIDEKRQSLAAVLEDSPLVAVVVSVLVPDYNRICAAHAEARKYLRDDIYECVLQSTVYECAKEVRDSGESNPCVAFVQDLSCRSEIYTRVYSGFKERNPEIAKFMRGMVHLDDKKWPGLQAADLIAHSVNRQFSKWDGVTQMKRPLGELNNTIHRIAYWNEDYMYAVLKKNTGLDLKNDSAAVAHGESSEGGKL